MRYSICLIYFWIHTWNRFEMLWNLSNDVTVVCLPLMMLCIWFTKWNWSWFHCKTESGFINWICPCMISMQFHCRFYKSAWYFNLINVWQFNGILNWFNDYIVWQEFPPISVSCHWSREFHRKSPVTCDLVHSRKVAGNTTVYHAASISSRCCSDNVIGPRCVTWRDDVIRCCTWRCRTHHLLYINYYYSPINP